MFNADLLTSAIAVVTLVRVEFPGVLQYHNIAHNNTPELGLIFLLCSGCPASPDKVTWVSSASALQPYTNLKNFPLHAEVFTNGTGECMHAYIWRKPIFVDFP